MELQIEDKRKFYATIAFILLILLLATIYLVKKKQNAANVNKETPTAISKEETMEPETKPLTQEEIDEIMQKPAESANGADVQKEEVKPLTQEEIDSIMQKPAESSNGADVQKEEVKPLTQEEIDSIMKK
jgi:hypothetical protein